jgi:hypothetical protein
MSECAFCKGVRGEGHGGLVGCEGGFCGACIHELLDFATLEYVDRPVGPGVFFAAALAVSSRKGVVLSALGQEFVFDYDDVNFASKLISAFDKAVLEKLIDWSQIEAKRQALQSRQTKRQSAECTLCIRKRKRVVRLIETEHANVCLACLAAGVEFIAQCENNKAIRALGLMAIARFQDDRNYFFCADKVIKIEKTDRDLCQKISQALLLGQTDLSIEKEQTIARLYVELDVALQAAENIRQQLCEFGEVFRK